jgi:hypothetical protein
MTPPRRFKDQDELTASEHEQRQRAAREGKPAPRFETDEYLKERREVLAKAGLDEDDQDNQEDDHR